MSGSKFLRYEYYLNSSISFFKLNYERRLKFLNKKNFLFKEIFEAKKINRPFELEDLGFLIAPIINSAGRLGNANDVVTLLTSNNLITKKRS